MRAKAGGAYLSIPTAKPTRAEPLSQARDLFTPPGATLLIAEIDDLLAQTSARAG